MSFVRHIFAISVSLTASIAIAQQPPQYSSVEDLPADVRGAFQSGYREFKQAMTDFAELQKKAAVEAPVYEFAKQKIEQAQRVGDGINAARRVDWAHFQQQGSEVQKNYKTWLGLYESVVAYDSCKDLIQDPSGREIVGEAALKAFETEGVDSGKWSLVQSLFPSNPRELTAARAADIWVEWLRLQSISQQTKLEELGTALNLTEAQRASALLWLQTQVVMPYLELYVSNHTPESLTNAERKAAAISVELTKIWPGWQKVLKEAEYSAFPDQKVASPPPPPDVASSSRRAFVVANIAFCLLLIGFGAYRYYRNRGVAGRNT